MSLASVLQVARWLCPEMPRTRSSLFTWMESHLLNLKVIQLKDRLTDEDLVHKFYETYGGLFDDFFSYRPVADATPSIVIREGRQLENFASYAYLSLPRFDAELPLLDAGVCLESSAGTRANFNHSRVMEMEAEVARWLHKEVTVLTPCLCLSASLPCLSLCLCQCTKCFATQDHDMYTMLVSISYTCASCILGSPSGSTGVAVSRWFQNQLILTTCQIRYHSHLWDHRRTGQL